MNLQSEETVGRGLGILDVTDLLIADPNLDAVAMGSNQVAVELAVLVRILDRLFFGDPASAGGFRVDVAGFTWSRLNFDLRSVDLRPR